MKNSKKLRRFLLLSVVVCTFSHTKQTIGSKRAVIGAKDWDRVIQLFRETVIRHFLQGESLNIVERTNDTATGWLLTIIQNKAHDGDTVWDKLQEKINSRVSENSVDKNLKNLTSDFNKIMRLMEKSRKRLFTKIEMDLIRSMSSNFFPQTYTSVTFTVKWLDALTKYLTILAAGYLDLMKSGDYDDCKLAEQLNMFRQLILDAAKKLAKSRYKALQKVKWSGGKNDFVATAGLTFYDPGSGKIFEDVPLTQLTGRLFTPMKQQMADIFMKHLVDQFNSLYNETWRGDSCTLLPLITVQDLEIDYPDECMDAEGICVLPCGHYMEDKAWCPTKLKVNKWQSHVLLKYWGECDPPDWHKCMFVTELQPSVWPDEYKTLKRKKIHDSMLDTTYNETTNDNNTHTELLNDEEDTMRAILGEDVLIEEEKKALSEEIANKVKIYMLEKEGKINNDDINVKSATLEQERIGLIEAFFLKALNAKRKYGNIKQYLSDLKKSAVFVLS